MGISCVPSEGDIISGNMALAAAALLGMGLLCGFEMLLLIWHRFRRRAGLYFWSLVIAAVAEIAVNISNILYYWVLRDSCPGIVTLLAAPGAFLFVLFEYFILYSRLRLIQTSTTKLRILLVAIVAEVLLVELPLAVITIGAAVNPLSKFTSLYYTMWQVEAVIYTVVDFLLSLTYILQIRERWNKESGPAVRSMLRDIVLMTVFVVGIDAANAGLVFVGSVFPIMYALEVSPSANSHPELSADFVSQRASFLRLS
jgi:hypothetical protein